MRRKFLVPPDLASLSTPSLLLERDVLVGNLDRMAARAAALGVTLRPHLKTSKSADVAALVQAVNDRIEAWVRARPEQWFWVHRRWRDNPLPSPAAPDASQSDSDAGCSTSRN